MALSQPGSAVEWWVFILMQCDPQTPSHSHSHSHWASRQSEAYFGLMCCQAPSLRFLQPPRHRGDPPSLPPSRLPLPRFVFLPRFVTLVVCQTKRAPLPFLFCFFSVRGGAGPAAACLLLALTMQSGFPLAQKPEPRWAVSHLTKRDYHDVDACCHTWPSSSSTTSSLRRPSSPWFTL